MAKEYYVKVNPGSPDRLELKTLGPYGSKAKATLILIEWLNKHFPLGWASNGQGLYMPDIECLAGYIAGVVYEEGMPIKLSGMEPALGGEVKHDD